MKKQTLSLKQMAKTILIAFAAALSIAPYAQADSLDNPNNPNATSRTEKKVGEGPNPFADCGIGAALFRDTEWAAVTSNIIWDLGSTAVTSATASPETCTNRKVKAALFIRDTYQQVAENAAKGEGQHLATALEILGCGGSNQAAAAGQVRGDMARAVSAPGYNAQGQMEKAGQLFVIIEGAAVLCGA